MSPDPQRRRRVFLTFLLILVPILFLLGWIPASLHLPFIRPITSEETLLLLALSAIIFLAFVIFALILSRILLKLYSERQQEKLGSRFILPPKAELRNQNPGCRPSFEFRFSSFVLSTCPGGIPHSAPRSGGNSVWPPPPARRETH